MRPRSAVQDLRELTETVHHGGNFRRVKTALDPHQPVFAHLEPAVVFSEIQHRVANLRGEELQHRRFIDADVARWGPVIKSQNIKPE